MLSHDGSLPVCAFGVDFDHCRHPSFLDRNSTGDRGKDISLLLIFIWRFTYDSFLCRLTTAESCYFICKNCVGLPACLRSLPSSK